MSSESVDAVSGAGERAHGLEPKLRFPEFQGAGAWAYRPLGAFANILDERVGSKTYTPYSITSGIGLVSQQEKFGRTIAGSQLKNYFVLQCQDFAYNKSATKEYPQGFAVMFESDAPGCVPASIFTCFRIHDSAVSAKYLNFLLRGNLHGRWLANYSAVGARANGSLAIDDKDLLALPVPLPAGNTSTTEQQKIADCLSSLDALIAAEGDRLAALKDHKKGLMQQLFPAKDQTTPRLRFPEFEGAEEWGVKPLESVCLILNNRRQPVSSVDRVPGPYPYYGASGIVDHISQYIFDEQLLLVGEDGAKWGAFEATAFLASGRYWVNNHAHVLKARGINQKLLEQYLVRLDLAEFVSGAAPPKLTLGKLKSIPIPVPPTAAEQEKISGLLLSMDEMLSAQADKLDALKTHKKGLMQQLFPSPAQATA